jgi:hypothetical protein
MTTLNKYQIKKIIDHACKDCMHDDLCLSNGEDCLWFCILNNLI